ncbi:hypothetical protein KXD97_15145 [Mycobacterium sp. SMC-8]|nr:hypothetical protein KXD97_15145 [Mycobacterium sp. SMC-8]
MDDVDTDNGVDDESDAGWADGADPDITEGEASDADHGADADGGKSSPVVDSSASDTFQPPTHADGTHTGDAGTEQIAAPEASDVDDLTAELPEASGVGGAVSTAEPTAQLDDHVPHTNITQLTAEDAAAPMNKTVGFMTKLLGALGITDERRHADSPIALALLACARRLDAAAASTGSTMVWQTTSQTGTTINVRDFGAVGDGVTDDSAAIKAAEAALTSSARLYFPEGQYRFAQQHPAGNAAILLKGLSNVTVEFGPGAKLLMDNLATNGHGTSHGLRVEGAASHVAILNPTIEWVTRPSARSLGDGISILGWPSDTAPPPVWTGSTGKVEYVSIVNARIVNTPQSGVVVMGASDVTVTNMTAIGTLADGLHFNASRRATVNGLVAQNTGDDGLAFVTYYHESQPWTYGPTDGPFNLGVLGEWNNGGSVASDITVTGGRANGFRVQGGYDITISDVTVTDKEFGFHVNSAKASHVGDWTSLASRDIRISDVTIVDVQTGVVLATNNIDGTEDAKWWNFSGVVISDVTIHGAKNWSLAVETPAAMTSKFAGVTLRNIYAETAGDDDGPNLGGNGGILLASLQNAVIDGLRLVSAHKADINLLGAAQMRSHLSAADLPSSNLTIDGMSLEGPGRILIQDIAGVQFGDVSSSGADSAAVELFRVKDASFTTITAHLPARGAGGGYGVRLLQVFDVDITETVVTMDDHVGSTWWAVELGGGNPQDGIAGSNVYVGTITYVSDRDATDSHIVVQGGPYGPQNWSLHASWWHGGEAQPQWRSATYGDVSPV